MATAAFALQSVQRTAIAQRLELSALAGGAPLFLRAGQNVATRRRPATLPHVRDNTCPFRRAARQGRTNLLVEAVLLFGNVVHAARHRVDFRRNTVHLGVEGPEAAQHLVILLDGLSLPHIARPRCAIPGGKQGHLQSELHQIDKPA